MLIRTHFEKSSVGGASRQGNRFRNSSSNLLSRNRYALTSKNTFNMMGQTPKIYDSFVKIFEQNMKNERVKSELKISQEFKRNSQEKLKELIKHDFSYLGKKDL